MRKPCVHYYCGKTIAHELILAKKFTVADNYNRAPDKIPRSILDTPRTQHDDEKEINIHYHTITFSFWKTKFEESTREPFKISRGTKQMSVYNKISTTYPHLAFLISSLSFFIGGGAVGYVLLFQNITHFYTLAASSSISICSFQYRYATDSCVLL